MLEIHPVTGIGEVRPGADLAALIVAAAPWLDDGDVLVVTSKIVSKAEGRLVEVPAAGPERDAAREALITAETVRTVASRGPTRIVQTSQGLVMAAAGIDASNVAPDRLVLLPVDPDASARALRAALHERYGVRVGVVITDTMGRPWRVGQTDVAIGAAGVPAIRDYRGEVDPYGNTLEVTQVAVIDELAAAGELVKGKYDGVPVAVVRGLPGGLTGDDGPGARVLVRDAELDMFSLGTAEARARGRADAAGMGSGMDEPTAFDGRPVDPEVVAGALSTIGRAFVHVTDPGVRDKLRDLAPPGAAEVIVPYLPSGADRWTAAQAGAAVHRLRAGLLAAGVATAWVEADRATVVALVDLPAGAEPLGLVAIGFAVNRSARAG